MIIDHTHPLYLEKRKTMSKRSRYNGAFYYSKEIVKNIIPNVKTDRNWVTIRAGEAACDDAIIFIHNNRNPERYDFLKNYKNLILVCGVPETCEKVAHLGTSLYLPLSVDVKYVEQFKCLPEEQHGVCYVGRNSKLNYPGIDISDSTIRITGMKRQELLNEMSKYKYVYAIGRTAIEAKILGCEVLPFDPRYPNPDIWWPLDTMDAAKMLQEELDKIDSR